MKAIWRGRSFRVRRRETERIDSLCRRVKNDVTFYDAGCAPRLGNVRARPSSLGYRINANKKRQSA